MASDASASTLSDSAEEASGETTVVEAPLEAVDAVVEMHRRIAFRLLAEKQPLLALRELVRAFRRVTMTPRLAAAMVRVALAAGAVKEALSFLKAGLEESSGTERRGVLRQLLRLSRRGALWEEASEATDRLLTLWPDDRRGRAMTNWLLQRSSSWELLDHSLARSTEEALHEEAFRRASRSELKRARANEDRAQYERAALCYGHAAKYAEMAGAPFAAFPLRVLWLRCLKLALAPTEALEEAIGRVLEAGDQAQQRHRARAILGAWFPEGLKSPAPSTPATSLTAETLAMDDSADRVSEDTLNDQYDVSVPGQAELLDLAHVAEARGASPEATALLWAAFRSGPEPYVARRLAQRLEKRGDGVELVSFYRACAERTQDPQERARCLESLARVSEVRGSGSDLDLDLDARLRRSLECASTEAARIDASVLCGQAALIGDDLGAAEAHFRAALALAPHHLQARAGWAETAALEGDAEPARLLQDALMALPVARHGRGELLRRMGRVLSQSPSDATREASAWKGVLASVPHDAEAQERLIVLLRASGDEAELEEVFRHQLKHLPAGPRRRMAQLDLVALLDRSQRHAEALAVLHAAAQAEPDRAVFLAYAERLAASSGKESEAARFFEQAAELTSHPRQRIQLWKRLGAFCRERLADDAQAARLIERADEESQKLLPGGAPPQRAELPKLLGGPLVIPPPRGFKSPQGHALRLRADFEALARLVQARLEPEVVSLAHVRIAPRISRQLPAARLTLREEIDLLGREAKSPHQQPAKPAEPHAPVESAESISVAEHETVETDAAATQAAAASAVVGTSPAKEYPPPKTLEALWEQVGQEPLQAEGYRLLASHYDRLGQANRSVLLTEVAQALEGVVQTPVPAPRLMLSGADRHALKHPHLRKEAGALLGLVGFALCRLFPPTDKGASEELQMVAGKGGRAAAEALSAGVRILGVASPPVFVSHRPGPFFSALFVTEPRVVVGMQALKLRVSDAELRFFAARALFASLPELLPLRSLKKEQVQEGLATVDAAIGRKGDPRLESSVRASVAPRDWKRVRSLFDQLQGQIDVAALADAARFSANRAGLVVCGAVGPALSALRLRKAAEGELVELLRFAASDKYARLRNRALPRFSP